MSIGYAALWYFCGSPNRQTKEGIKLEKEPPLQQWNSDLIVEGMRVAHWMLEVDWVVQARVVLLSGKQETLPDYGQLETGRQGTPLWCSGGPRLVDGCTKGFGQWECAHWLSGARPRVHPVHVRRPW